MQADQYQEEAGATESRNLHSFTMYQPYYHAAFGLVTEAAEFADVMKKQLFYGKAPDLTNLDEEIGDILWYVAIYLNARGKTFEQIFDQNNAKLKTRFPDKFTEFNALNRDLDAERKVLEGE